MPITFRNVLVNWENCYEKPDVKLCPLIAWYGVYSNLGGIFDYNYTLYLRKCKPAATPYLLPVRTARNIKLPSLEAYLQFVHGWVPFRVGPDCGVAQVPELPTADQPPTAWGQTVINYQVLQYDFMNFANKPFLKPVEGRQFNKYVEFVHGPQPNFLDASAYAYSIDDLQSFQHFPGDGLVFTIGGGLASNIEAGDFPTYLGSTSRSSRIQLGSPFTLGAFTTLVPTLPVAVGLHSLASDSAFFYVLGGSTDDQNAIDKVS